MQRFFTLVLFIVFSLSGLVASSQIFIKMTDNSGSLVGGESNNAAHKNEIEATSFGQENTGCVVNSSGPPASCAGTVGRFIFNMNINQSLPLINKALFTGKAMRTVEIFFTKTSGNGSIEYYKIKLESAYVTHVTNAAENGTVPSVQVALDAAIITWTYTPQRPDGSMGTPVVFVWDAVQKRVL